MISFKIKLTALNALLLALRSGNTMKGYIVVTEELIKYASSLQLFAERIQSGIFKKVEHLSTQLREEVMVSLLKKINISKKELSAPIEDSIIDELIRKFSLNSKSFISTIQNIHKDIESILIRNDQFITHGQMLAIHAKIESSASQQLRDSFSYVSNDLESQTARLKQILNEIQHVLYLNIKTLEKKLSWVAA